ncbi:multiprotein-bridging factor 1 family protein [Planctomycetota bacterium]
MRSRFRSAIAFNVFSISFISSFSYSHSAIYTISDLNCLSISLIVYFYPIFDKSRAEYLKCVDKGCLQAADFFLRLLSHGHPFGTERELLIITIKRHPYGFSSYYPSNPKTLGEQIRKKRLDLGLTAKQVADKLKVHERTILNWETGKVKLKGKHMDKAKQLIQLKLVDRHYVEFLFH